ncbi:MAG: PAS domain-containing protein, partial [Ghiorsea sp.]
MLQKKIPLRIAWYGLILLSSLVPAIVLAPWLVNQGHDLLLDQMMLSEKIFHNELETRIDLETERLVSVLQNKSDPIRYSLSQEGGGDAQLVNDLLSKIDKREPMVTSSSIYDLHAKIIFSKHKQGHTISNIQMDSSAFVIAMRQRVFIGSPLRLDDGDFEFLISTPLIDKGETIAVLVSTIKIDEFWRSIRKKLPDHNSKVYLIDGRGSLLINQLDSHYKQGDLLSKHAIVRSLLAHKDWRKLDAYKGFENSDVFGIGTAIPGLGWGIISEIPKNKINNPIQSSLITLVVIVFLLYIIFSVFGLLFTRRLINPISVLSELMQKATKGDYKHLAIKPSLYQEINELGLSFETMMREIDIRKNSLKKQNYIMAQLSETLMITDQYGVIEYVNPAFVETTGYSFDEAVGTSSKLMSSGVQSKAFYTDMWATILLGNHWEGRLINRKKDGTLYPIIMSIAPVYYEEKLTNFIAVQQDMSEQ